MSHLTTMPLLAAFAITGLLSAQRIIARAQQPFRIYDNMFYKGKPNTTRDGLALSNILYENAIWPAGVNYGVLPNRGDFEALVRKHAGNPGPLVVDIEKLPLKGSPEVARHNLQTLVALMDWAHAAVPGKPIGYYGTNTLSGVPPASLPYARELARHVDAFFPPMYTFDDDRAAWEKRAQDSTAEARMLGPGKPVYFYLWPQYHDGTPKQFEYIDAGYWKFQLETARRYSDGLVLWSPSKYEWNDATGWWPATLQFAHSFEGH